ncbi:Uncharacterised protein [Phocoenobacter uteri]|uniref:Uncharacterized protein n=1 Tax=Phocoenobacter uteri TaxID=146806 RepID=A0A379C8G7_9PAST|nr:hypothetical protein [Phocoenobacter uteri]MDG6882443.1 hypothetical protein [Phocoenobacter uteri]SUB58603.1 Uncharacterised protein [Phocoenobacter uteri]
MNTIKKSHFLIGGSIFTLALIYAMFSQLIANTGQIPWFLIGIYLLGMIQAMLFYTFGHKIFAKGTISSESSAIIAYHAWACFVFGLMLIFNTEELLHSSTGFTSILGNNNDRVGLQLTQICGAWVLAYSLLSYCSIFFTKDNAKTALWLHSFAIFAQLSEVLIKYNSDGGIFGLGARINTHHVIIQIIGLLFLFVASRKIKNK